MTDKEKLKAILEWAEEAYEKTVFNDCDAGIEHAARRVLDILEAKPDPQPLASVRFDEARAKEDKHKDFLEFFGAHGFEFEMDRSFYIAGKKAKRASLEFGVNVFGSVMVGAISVNAETFGEALRLLNEVAGTEMMGGWE